MNKGKGSKSGKSKKAKGKSVRQKGKGEGRHVAHRTFLRELLAADIGWN
jgi:hypothetical protein